MDTLLGKIVAWSFGLALAAGDALLIYGVYKAWELFWLLGFIMVTPAATMLLLQGWLLVDIRKGR